MIEMDGTVGYEHRHNLWKEDHLFRPYNGTPSLLFLREKSFYLYDGKQSQPSLGEKSFLFAIQTTYLLKGGHDKDLIIDKDRFQIWMPVSEDTIKGKYRLGTFMSWQLQSHEVIHDIRKLAVEAYDFAKKTADDPSHASLHVVPIVVDFEVCTVQQENESQSATIDRLVPLYLKMDGRVGYEYRHSFWKEDQIINLYDVTLFPRTKIFLFEIRTTFTIKRKHDGDEIIDSERFDICVPEEDIGKHYVDFYIRCRLRDYWMSHREICQLADEAYDFAKKIADDPLHACGRIIPVVVALEVCTVQQDNESLFATMERSISAKRLVPSYLSAFTTASRKKSFESLLTQSMIISPKIRVKNIDEGLALMQVCHICSRNPSPGAQISVLSQCRHAFHSHCLIHLLEKSMLCPVCHSNLWEKEKFYKFDKEDIQCKELEFYTLNLEALQEVLLVGIIMSPNIYRCSFDGDLKGESSCSRFASVNNFGVRYLPDDVVRKIGSFLPVDSIAHLQAVNFSLCRALEPMVAAERFRRKDPAQLAVRLEVVLKQRASAQIIADEMHEGETYYGMLSRLIEEEKSIVPFHKAGDVLGRLTNNPNMGREYRAYFVRLCKA